jgi:formyl-CoA transferase
MFEQHAFKDGTPIKLPAITPKLSATPGVTKWIGPALGEHNDAVLSELGYDAATIAQLRNDKII